MLVFWVRSAWKGWRESGSEGTSIALQENPSGGDNGQSSLHTTGSYSFNEKESKENHVAPLPIVHITHPGPQMYTEELANEYHAA